MLAIAIKANNTITSLNISDNPITNVARYSTDKDEAAMAQPETSGGGGATKSKKADTKGLVGLAEAVKMSASLAAITLESTKGATLPIEMLKGVDKKARTSPPRLLTSYLTRLTSSSPLLPRRASLTSRARASASSRRSSLASSWYATVDQTRDLRISAAAHVPASLPRLSSAATRA